MFPRSARGDTIIIITASILNLGFKQLRQKYWRTQKCIIHTENIHKYLQQQNQAKLIAKSSKYWRLPKILAYTQNIGACLKYLLIQELLASAQNVGAFSKYMLIFKIYAHVQNICAYLKYMRISKIYAPHNIRQ